MPPSQWWELHGQRWLKDSGTLGAGRLGSQRTRRTCKVNFSASSSSGWTWLVSALQLVSHPLVCCHQWCPQQPKPAPPSLAGSGWAPSCRQVLGIFPSSLALKMQLLASRQGAQKEQKKASALLCPSFPSRKKQKGQENSAWETPSSKGPGRLTFMVLCPAAGSDRDSSIFGHR